MKVAFITDALNSFNIKKDTTYMMMLSVAKKNWETFIFEMQNIFVENTIPFGIGDHLSLTDDDNKWYTLLYKQKIKLETFDVIFMRKDPPFNIKYIYMTYILELTEKKGVLIVNNPQSLRNFNEKFCINNYPNFIPKMMVTSQLNQINKFIKEYKDVIVKPLDNMGGKSIFRILPNDKNKNVIIENITKDESELIMIQEFIPEIKEGDKRIFLIDGDPIKYLVARIPNNEDYRGNLACGASIIIRQLTKKEYKIASIIGKSLKKNNILFAGIDMIGFYLTEINITSPTMAKQIYDQVGINITDILMDVIEKKINI